jgi:hypothetical protein
MKTWQQLGLLLLLAGALFAILPGLFIIRPRKKPEDQERLRRLEVNRKGRLGEALINDVQNDTIFYSYEIAGVAYHAAQDVTGLWEQLPHGVDRLVGHAKVKYETNNPANSILVCEQWSGIRPSPVRANSESD